MMDDGLSGKDRVCLVPSDNVDTGCCARGIENRLNRRLARSSNAELDAWPRAGAVDPTCLSLLELVRPQ